jgi:hypothetical protein
VTRRVQGGPAWLRVTCQWLVLLALMSGTWGHAGVPARAQEPVPERRFGVRWEGSTPRLSFSARDLLNGEVRRKLDSGLPQTLTMRVYAFRTGGRPVAVVARSCRVVFDLWDELYRVQVQTAEADRTELVRSLSEVLDLCLVARRAAVGRAPDWEGRSGQEVHFAVIVEFNPLSPDTIERIRRWLARPARGGAIEGDAFFGSFVSLFVNRRIGEAERILRFRSQPVRVP